MSEIIEMLKKDDEKIRASFPLLNNRKDVYLDNAATTQKPKSVIDAWDFYYENSNSNPFRGVYELSSIATDAYEEARSKTASFIGAKENEIIFTRNASESINLLAYSFAPSILKAGDEIIVSIAEHHSNFLPWQMVAERIGVKVIFFNCEEDGHFSEEKLLSLITKKTKLLAITHVSNVLGRINDIKTFAKIMHENDAYIVCDGAQSVPHIKVDVKDLDVDFLAFSGHKMLAPMGIGVLYGKYEHLEAMPPFLYGGEMIETVTTNGATYASVPHKFEAGTVNVGGAVALSKAIDYYNEIGFERIIEREKALTIYAMEKMQEIEGIVILGSKNKKEHEGIITFLVDGVHPHDVASIMDADGVCVRAGHHCAQPLLQYLYDLRKEKNAGGISTTRVSIAFYNTIAEIDKFIESLSAVRSKMGLRSENE